MSKLAILLFFSLTYITAFSQNLRTLYKEDYNLDSLKNLYGKNKTFIKDLELQSLIALSYYPELKNARITFKAAHKESIAKTTVTFFSLFSSSDKHFIIYINALKTSTGVLLSDASFNAQIGAIAHELAHVADFKSKGLLEMIWWGLTYLEKNHRIKKERQTDMATIQHGLGWQLYDFTYFVLSDSSVNNRYRKFKEKNYFHPEEISQLLKENGY